MFVYDKDLRQPMMDMRPVLDHTQTPAQSNVQFTDFSPNGSTILTNSSVTNRYDPVNNSIKLNPDKLTQSQPLFPLLPPFVYPVNSWLQQLSPTAPLQETLSRIYQSFFGLFERQLSQRLEQFSTRLDNFQREQTFTKTQVSRLERIVQTRLVTPVLTEDGEKSISEMNGVTDETNSNHLSTGWYDVPSTNMWTNASTSSPINCESARLLIRPETSTIHTNSVSSEIPSAASLPDLTRLHLERNLFYSPPITNTTASTTMAQTGLRELNSLTRLGSPSMSATLNHVTNTLFHSSIQSHLFWNQWTSDWIRANSGLTGRCSTTTTDNNNNNKNNNNNSVISSCSNNNDTEDRDNNSTANSFTALLEKIRASGATITDSTPTCTNSPGDWPNSAKAPGANNATTYRSCKLTRLRGRRLRGQGRNVWSHLYEGARTAAFKRTGPYNRPGYHASQLSSSVGFFKDFSLSRSKTPELHSVRTREETELDATEPNEPHNEYQDGKPPIYAHLYDQNCFVNRNVISTSHPSPTKSANLVGNPIVILNPKEPREIFIGGIHSVPLPLWAYKKCLTMVRGEPHELGPRLCLRLLQSLFSLNYLVTHNYNGSGGKAPIDPTVMGAVLRQAQIQFGSGYFFTEPMALGKLRDYLNNAFRVMAFRQRKGERVRSPFWNDQGEPVHGLEAPVEFADTSDVIVLTPTTDLVGAIGVGTDVMRINERPDKPLALDTIKSHERGNV